LGATALKTSFILLGRFSSFETALTSIRDQTQNNNKTTTMMIVVIIGTRRVDRDASPVAVVVGREAPTAMYERT